MDKEDLRKLAEAIWETPQFSDMRQQLKEIDRVVFGDRNNLEAYPGIARKIDDMDKRSKRNSRMLMAVGGMVAAPIIHAAIKAVATHL